MNIAGHQKMLNKKHKAIFVVFDNVTGGMNGSATVTNYTAKIRFSFTPTQNIQGIDFWLRDGQSLPDNWNNSVGFTIVKLSDSFIMLFNRNEGDSGITEFGSISDIDTDNPTINPYGVTSGTITIEKIK